MAGPPNNWDKRMAEVNMFTTWPADTFPETKPFDPHSIMAYPMPKEWTSLDSDFGYEDSLSSVDKDFIENLRIKALHSSFGSRTSLQVVGRKSLQDTNAQFLNENSLSHSKEERTFAALTEGKRSSKGASNKTPPAGPSALLANKQRAITTADEANGKTI